MGKSRLLVELDLAVFRSTQPRPQGRLTCVKIERPKRFGPDGRRTFPMGPPRKDRSRGCTSHPRSPKLLFGGSCPQPWSSVWACSRGSRPTAGSSRPSLRFSSLRRFVGAIFYFRCARQGSNLGPTEYQSIALPAELRAHCLVEALAKADVTKI